MFLFIRNFSRLNLHFECLMKNNTKELLTEFGNGKYFIVHLMFESDLLWIFVNHKIFNIEDKYFKWHKNRNEVIVLSRIGYFLLNFSHISPLDGKKKISYILLLNIPKKMPLRQKFIYQVNIEKFINRVNDIIQPKTLKVFSIPKKHLVTVEFIFKVLYPQHSNGCYLI